MSSTNTTGILDQIRQRAQTNLAKALEIWAKGDYPPYIDVTKIVSEPMNRLMYHEVLALSIDADLNTEAFDRISQLDQVNDAALASIRNTGWREATDRRPILASIYLSTVWIPAFCRKGAHRDAISVATRLLMQLRSRRFSRVLGAGNGDSGGSDSSRSLRLMLMAPVFNSLAVHISGDDPELKMSIWHLLESFFSEEDISPCAAIWAPAVAYVAGIDCPRQWLISELESWSELRVLYLAAADELADRQKRPKLVLNDEPLHLNHRSSNSRSRQSARFRMSEPTFTS